MPAVGTPSMPTPLYNANATGGNGGTRPLPPITTNNMNREPQPHPSAQAAAANNGGTPSNATPSSDPSTNSKRSQGSSTTMPTTQDASVAHRSGQAPGANAHGTPSTAPPQQDGNPSLKRHHSLSTSTTKGGGQRYRSAQEAHHGRSDDQEKVDPGLRKYTDQGGHRTQGDEGARKLKKSPPSSKEASTRSTGTRERQGSNDSIDITVAGRDGQSYSPTDNERRSDHSSGASKAAAPPANVQSQPKHGSQHTTTTYSRAHMKEKPQSANHSETGSNASDTRAGDSINPRHPQPGSKPAHLPPGAAEAQPPTARRNRETQPGEDDSTDDHSTQPSHGVDDSADDPIQISDDESDGSRPQPPGGLGEGQNVQGEGGENNIAPSSGYFGGIGRSIAGVILGPGGSAQPPRDRTKEELHRTRAKLQQLEYEFRRARSDNANLHRTCFELDSENRRNKETIRSLQHELTNMGRELQEYKHLSDIRGRELIGAQVFLTKADLLSISDVKDKVNALNDENFQASASLGDSLVHFKYESTKDDKEAAFAEASRIISDPLARVLVKETQKPEPEINPLLVQVVLEMYLVHFCSSMIASWFPGNLDTSDFLTSVYSEIRRTEEQAVSGRWRALTRAQIRPVSTTWREEFMGGLGNIFKIAEWSIGSQENLIAFEQKLPAIFKAIGDLRLALGEKVTSIDLEVNVAPPGVVFNHQWMQDGYGDARQGNTKKSGEPIAGTTGIGLKKVLPSPSGEELFENVLAPKVVLVSTLQEALLPAPPPTSRSNKKARVRVGVEGEQEGRGRSSPSKGSVDT